MKKTTIELTDEHYFFLKEKAIQIQKQNQRASVVSVIRALIDKDMKESNTKHTKIKASEADKIVSPQENLR